MTDHVTHFISHTTVYRALNVKQQRFSYFPIVLCTFYWVYINVTVQPRFHAAGARAQTKNPLNDRYHNIWSGQQHNSYSGWQDEDFKLCCLLLLKMFSENRFLASCLLTKMAGVAGVDAGTKTCSNFKGNWLWTPCKC